LILILAVSGVHYGSNHICKHVYMTCLQKFEIVMGYCNYGILKYIGLNNINITLNSNTYTI